MKIKTKKDIVTLHPFITIDIKPYLTRDQLSLDIMGSREFIISTILIYLKSFNNQIRKTRLNVGLSKIIKYPSIANLEDLNTIEHRILEIDKHEKLKIEVSRILIKYRLGNNWRLPILIAILTNHLPVPFREKNINTYTPLIINKDRSDYITWGDVAAHHNENFPMIYFTARTSPTELISWIKENREEIERINDYFPAETKIATRLKLRTLKIGIVALYYKQIGVNKWINMDNELSRMSDEDVETLWDKKGSPTSEEIRLAYKSYIDACGKFDDSKFVS